MSAQTRSVLDKQLREGAPVKGVLDNSPDRAKPNGQMDDDVSLLADDSNNMQRRAKGDKVAKYDDPNRQARRLGLGNGSFMQAKPGAANDPEVAKAFGLVLGSPEFQRR